MAIPYDTTNAGTDVRAVMRHSSIKVNGSWQYLEDTYVKDGGAWREVKETWVKRSGTWRKVHEGEHFLFKHDLSSNFEGGFELGPFVNFTLGYSGNKVKGLITIKQNVRRQQVDLGNFSSDSLIYLRLELNARIQGRGGNGGNATGAGSGSGPNGQNGQRALYTRTPFILDNASLIVGGGGGGAGGENSYHQYVEPVGTPCGKGSTCYQNETFQVFKAGGGGGGGAGYPGGNGGLGGNSNKNGFNGGQDSGGAGGGNSGDSSHSGGAGGNMGQNGQDTTGGGVNGNSGAAIDGWSYRVQESGNGYQEQNIRGPKIN